MNKKIALIGLFFVLFLGTLQGQNNRYLLIDFAEQSDQTINNYQHFSFQTADNKTKSGKISILNDSQFCFVNYFLEPVGPIYTVDDIHQIFVKGKGVMKYKISTGATIAIALLIPGGIYFLLIREAVRQIKRKRNLNNEIQSGWQNKQHFKAKIITEPTSV